MTRSHDMDKGWRPQLVSVEGTFNFRDIGGRSTARTHSVREGLLFRSDALSDLTDRGKKQLEALGIRTVIDLREPRELEVSPDDLDGLDLVHVNIAAFEGRLMDDKRQYQSESDRLHHAYQRMLTDHGGQASRILELLVKPQALPAVIHCTAGKDRTGIIIALLLNLLGVDDSRIIADYSASENFLGTEFVERIINRFPPDVLPEIMKTDPTAAPSHLIESVLSTIATTFGGIDEFFIRNGASEETISRFRTLFSHA